MVIDNGNHLMLSGNNHACAYARSIAAEMHSGFRPLREHLSFALLERRPGEGLHGPGVAADIARIEAIWTTCRETWGKKEGGPFLFGHYTIADAMYAPVCTRFRTYDVELDDRSAAVAVVASTKRKRGSVLRSVVLVSDVDMPRMSGLELTAKIRSDKNLAALPIVLVTAQESTPTRPPSSHAASGSSRHRSRRATRSKNSTN